MNTKAWRLRAEQWDAVIAACPTQVEASRRLGVDPTTIMRYQRQMEQRGLRLLTLTGPDERIDEKHLLRTFSRMRDREIDSTLECLREMALLQADIKRRG
jgi:transposase